MYSGINTELKRDEVEINAVRASGPGGQNVNKVSSAVHLRFNIFNSSLKEETKEKLYNLNDSRITDQGIIIIKSKAHRSLDKNREEAFERLEEIIKKASKIQKKRKKTKPNKKAVQKRLDSKKKRGEIKKLRKRI